MASAVLWNLSGLSSSIRTRREVISIILAHAGSSPSEEVCGFLAGRQSVITLAFAAVNIAPSPATSYDVEPREIVEKMREIRAANLEFLGIYHSHPNSINEPSPTDIELAAYPDAAYFILSPRADAPNPIRAFQICDGVVQELTIEIIEENGSRTVV